MNTFSVEGARVVVVGAARSGIAAAELLARRGATVTLTDRKDVVDGAERLRGTGVALELGAADAAAVHDADLVVTSPGVPLELPALMAVKAHGIPVIGELELAFRWLRGRVVAITGTKGKSTTTTLVGRMLETAGRRVLVGGNIGVPLSSQVDESTEDTVHVVEASSFQLETTETFRPWIAALLNFSPDHLDRHPDEAAYGRAKARIFANQAAGDWAVVNADNASAVALASNTRARRLQYAVDHTSDADVFVERDFIWQRTSEGLTPLVPLAAIELAGRHMLSNVAAASAICLAAGASGEAMARALGGFRGLEHVMEPVATLGGVRFVNDSKATNVDAAARSIESFDRVVAIIGGRYKGGAFEDLRQPLASRGKGVVAIGEARPLVRQALADVVRFIEADSMADAVRKAVELARPDGVVLLAPACSSFDMFVDYADRGRAFKEEVRRVVTEGRGFGRGERVMEP
ncbi:MAG TPA: UDP-N-acetylmuramoyl-L-alanine--D-glutamate ligase [Vicinamibacterales bacterium]|nr:UDP-N-acetylmuramoyl-L-alanine--D-glutamate ligase [Vicinamibacterales bacterium]